MMGCVVSESSTALPVIRSMSEASSMLYVQTETLVIESRCRG